MNSEIRIFETKEKDLFATTPKGGIFLINPESGLIYEDHTDFGLPEGASEISPETGYDIEIPEILEE